MAGYEAMSAGHSGLRFKDKVAIVTGGCKGIGRGCVDILAENGGKVVVLDIDDVTGAALRTNGPGEITFVHCDLTQEDKIKYALPYLRKSSGSIVNISSAVSICGQADAVTYTATKGGITAMTKALAIDEAKHGVRVNSISPGTTWTPLIEELIKPIEDKEKELERYSGQCLMRRLGDVREIGKACLFLATDATYTTGENLSCSGGMEVGFGQKY